MSNYKGTPWAPIESQVDMMRSHVIRPAVRDPKRDSDQHTFVLARPPAWSEGVPCLGDFARFDESVGLKAGEAAARCAGCPVIEECLSAAMEEERGLSAGSRYGIRGGMSPKERAALDEKGLPRGKRPMLRPIRDAERNDRVRSARAARRASCLLCRVEVIAEVLPRHMARFHDQQEEGAA